MSEGAWDAMLRHEEAEGLTDRIGLAHELLELAGRFEIEADHWSHEGMRLTRRRLLNSAHVLEAFGRIVLGGEPATRAVVEAYRDAALELLKSTIAKRRKLEAMLGRRRQLDAALAGTVR